jgi:hypothetical protein
VKALLCRLSVVSSLICLTSCSNFVHWAFATEARKSDTPRQIETFTGQVVLVSTGYRFRPSSETEAESANLKRLTRSKKGNGNYESNEIYLRKYFGKMLTVRGETDGDWIVEADILGQWLHPGEPTGPNMSGPREQ